MGERECNKVYNLQIDASGIWNDKLRTPTHVFVKTSGNKAAHMFARKGPPNSIFINFRRRKNDTVVVGVMLKNSKLFDVCIK